MYVDLIRLPTINNVTSRLISSNNHVQFNATKQNYKHEAQNSFSSRPLPRTVVHIVPKNLRGLAGLHNTDGISMEAVLGSLQPAKKVAG